MTAIFAYPLSNGWVIVGDRLESDIHKTIREREGYEVFPSQMSIKIEENNSWILAFAGDSKQIDEKIKPIFYAYPKISRNFKKICSQIKNLYSDLDRLIGTEGLFFNILKNKCYKINFSELNSEKLKDYMINSIDNGFIGSGLDKCRGNALLSSLIELKSYNFKRTPSKIIRKSVSVLNNISILDFQFTGSPYIYGCDIFIISAGLVKKYEIIPDGFLFKGSMARKWVKIDR